MVRITKATAKGFTLVELVTVIIVLGVVSVGISGFIRTGVQIYADVTERDQLLGDSRFVVERIHRELRIAIPNSSRVKANNAGNIQCLEFVPAAWVSFYTSLSVLPALTTRANIVEFANNAANFSLEVNDFAIVYPTSNLDVYDLNNNKRKVITACTVNDNDDCNQNVDPNGIAELTVSGAFEDHSPASRLYIASTAVSYCAHSSGEIYRIEDAINTTQTVYSSGTLMAENLKNNFSQSNEAPFRIYEATLTRNGLVHILLAFERNEEIINYSSEVHIPNVP
ncbi:type II secretion system protein J [Paraglaciecola sp. MB-3u-78]|jgi:MSHA biogenesis protein MshO|uniref:PulJ/GspJ family protein n=1 Tax=Paraglaciecola sp. MB-3u-78 TaxID=2058332 RepID=UPI000C347BD8|nr:prepilin-type N-terminal cleavage/methylation domain-containing protein [Paraglaciecola sp. MB-3u-78]PKG97787.1 prepilin-type cleavage/methylation domain-containing protein [Paraglaciecola sp. MB-3u-78]